MRNKEIDKPGKWKPKCKWMESMTIDLENRGKTTYKYYIPKTQEEEREMYDKWNAKMEPIYDMIFCKALENFRKNKGSKIGQ